MKSDGFQVEATIEVDGGNDVLEGGDYTFDSGDVLLFEGKRDRGRRDGRSSRWTRRPGYGIGG